LSIVTFSHNDRVPSLVPPSSRLHAVDVLRNVCHRRVNPVRVVRTVMLVVAIAGPVVVPGAAARLNSGALFGTHSAVTAEAPATGPATAFARLSNCPGGTVPCP
jgi:hypothetical protein